MADLVTHLGTALLWKAATGRPHLVSFCVGVMLPDLLGRAPVPALQLLVREGVPVPGAVVEGVAIAHMPLGMALCSALVACAFVERQRAAVLYNLLGGCALHLALDLTQTHLGRGYFLFWPFWDQDFELKWIGSEATTPFALPVLALGVLALAARRRQKGSSTSSGKAPAAGRGSAGAGRASAGRGSAEEPP